MPFRLKLSVSMASRIAKRIAFRDVPAVVPQLARLELTLSSPKAAGAVGARRIQQILLPAIRYWNPEASVIVAPPPLHVRKGKDGSSAAAAELPIPKLVASFTDGKKREFDPAKENPLSIIADLLALPRLPKPEPAAAASDAAAAPSTDAAAAPAATASASGASAAAASSGAGAAAAPSADAEKKAEGEAPAPPKTLPDGKLRLYKPAKWMRPQAQRASTAELLKSVPQLKPIFRLRPPTKRQGNGAYKVLKRKRAAKAAWIARLKARIDAEQSVL